MAEDPPPPPPPQLPPPRRPHKQFQPRGYQVDVFAAALRGNTIAVLDTGTGKTMVAIMLAREHVRRVRAGEAPRRVVVFLAPTVHLVHQQFGVIEEYTDLDAVECHGASGVGEWTAEDWNEQIGSKDIVVMTPQVLLDALRHAFLSMSAMSLLIFDECHRACGNHPYSRIMKEFYIGSEWGPAVFGMTASPVATKGVYTIEVEAQAAQLELILDSKVYIVEDRNELESFSSSAAIVSKYYDAYLVDFDDLKSRLQILFEEFDSMLVSLQESSPNKFEDTDSILEMSRKTLSRYHGKIFYGLNTLGPVVTLEVVKIYSDSIKTLDDSEDCIFSKASMNLHVSFFKEVLCLIEEILPQGQLYETKVLLGLPSLFFNARKRRAEKRHKVMEDFVELNFMKNGVWQDLKLKLNNQVLS